MDFFSIPGLVPYSKARALQHRLVEERAADLIPDTVLFLEHAPVITRGRGLQFNGEARARHMPLPAELPPGIEFCDTERGGDLTYHGPGQLVIYPICKLDGQGFGPARDVEEFIRRLEQVLIGRLLRLGIPAEYRPNATGVWIGQGLAARKVASIGISVRKWVTFHGMAINCVNDLTPFSLISPCGFSPEVMGSLSGVLSRELWERFAELRTADSWRPSLERIFAHEFSADARIRELLI